MLFGTRLVAVCFALALPGLASAQWQYQSKPDPMSEGKTHYARTQSVNAHQFRFPYQGGTRVWLTLMQLPDGQHRVVLQANRGQFMCRPDDCEIRARFDDGEAVTVSMAGAQDGSPDVLFVDDEPPFIEKLAAANRLRVEMLFYQEGTRMFEFRTRGLKWPPAGK